MNEPILLRQCPHCGAKNYSRLADCLLCGQPLTGETPDPDEMPTIRPGSSSLVMFLEVVSGPVDGEKFLLKNGMALGRSKHADIPILSEKASRQHAEITLDNHQRWVLKDLGSTNGTIQNGVTISSPVVLKPGDVIEVGDGIFKVKGGV